MRSTRFAVGPILYRDELVEDLSTSRSFQSPCAVQLPSSRSSSASPTPSLIENLVSFNDKEKSDWVNPRDVITSSLAASPMYSSRSVPPEVSLAKSPIDTQARSHLISMADRVQKVCDKLTIARSVEVQKLRELEAALHTDEQAKRRAFDNITEQLEGMERKNEMESKMAEKEMMEWRRKTSELEDILFKVRTMERRVASLSKEESKMTNQMSNIGNVWDEFIAVRTQASALEIASMEPQAKTLLKDVPENVQTQAANDLQELSNELSRLMQHLRQNSKQRQLAMEVHAYAEALFPIFANEEDRALLYDSSVTTVNNTGSSSDTDSGSSSRRHRHTSNSSASSDGSSRGSSRCSITRNSVSSSRTTSGSSPSSRRSSSSADSDDTSSSCNSSRSLQPRVTHILKKLGIDAYDEVPSLLERDRRLYSDSETSALSPRQPNTDSLQDNQNNRR